MMSTKIMANKMITLYENYLQYKEHGPYFNTHRSTNSKYNPFNRYIGRHKALGATPGCHLKQFDRKRWKAHRLFFVKSATQVYGRRFPVFRFGVVGKKFLYKKS